MFFGLVAWRHWGIWRGRVGIGWDVNESYWPDLAFLANEFRRWNFPLWNPYERGGYPAHADPQPALFSPLQWAWALWTSRNRASSWYAIQVKELFHYALAGTLLHLYLRTRKIPWPAALLGGVTLVLSGPWFIQASNNFLYTVAWAPLVWVAVDRLFEAPRMGRGAALAGALYLAASEGSPPGYFYLLLTAVCYALFRALPWLVLRIRPFLSRWSVSDAERSSANSDLRRVAQALATALLLTVATQLILLLPTRDLLAYSWRGALPPSYALAQSCPAVPTLTSIVAPNTGAFNVNMSFIAVALALFGALASPAQDRGTSVFFLASAAFCLALSLGASTPILGWLVGHVPGFGLFRTSCRYVVPYALFLAPAAGFGLSSVLHFGARPKGRARVALLATAALLGAAVALVIARVPQASLKPPFPSGLWLMVGLCLAALAVLLHAPRRWASVLSIGLVGVVSFDTTRFYGRDSALHPRPDHYEDLGKVRNLQGLDQYRIFDDFVLEQRSGSRLSLREFRGYLISDPLALKDHSAIVSAAVLSPQILGEYNVRYVLYGPHSIKGWGRKVIAAEPDTLSPGRFRRLDARTFEVVHPAPMVAWYGKVRVLPEAELLPALLQARDTGGVRRLAFASAEDFGAAGTNGRLSDAGEPPPSVPGKLLRFGTESVEVEVQAPAPGVVVLNEVYFPGWRVFVDEREQPPFRVDLLLRGVFVDGGYHRIRWVYEPRRWPALLGLWAGGLLAIVALLIRAGGIQRRRAWQTLLNRLADRSSAAHPDREAMRGSGWG